MMKITSNQWNKTSKDYKSIIEGQKYIMHRCSLIPIEIDDINGLELNKWVFEELGVAFNCYAWTEEEALQIIKDSGHCLKYVTNLRIVK